MMRRALIWSLDSPPRLVLALVVSATLLVSTAMLAIGSQHDTRPMNNSHPSDLKDPPAPRSKPSTGTEGQVDDEDSRQVAERFLAAYVRGYKDRRPKADTALRRYSTDELWRGLRLTKPSHFPAGPIQTVDRTVAGTFMNEYAVRLDDGGHLVVHVVASGRGWRVSDVQAADR